MQPNQEQPDYSYLYQKNQPLGPQEQQDPNRMKRIIIGGGLLFLFIMIVIAVATILLAGPNHRLKLSEIAAEQNEIARVAAIVRDNDRASIATRADAAVMASVAISNRKAVENYVQSEYPEALTKGELESAASTVADTRLEAAAAANRLDDEFDEVMRIVLSGANNRLRTFFNELEDDVLRTLLNSLYTDNELLLSSTTD